MLIIGRFEGESVVIENCIEIKVETLKNNKVILAIDAPPEIFVCRKEYQQKVTLPASSEKLLDKF